MKINMKGYEELKKAHKEKAEISKTDLIKVCCRIANAAAELEDETAGILNASIEMVLVLKRYARDTQDVLFECGEYKDMLIDDAIEITAWMPFPEPYMEESEDDHMVTISSSLWKSLRAAADYQIPKKSKVVYECSAHLRIRENRCPTCGTCLDKRWDKYCFQCGQRIDWSDGKEHSCNSLNAPIE